MTEVMKFNLVPTTHLTKCPKVSEGGLKLREISIVLGNETEKVFDPIKLVAELSRIDAQEVQFVKSKPTYTFKIMIPEKLQNEKITEIGLFVKKSSTDLQGSLIAYYHQKTPISKQTTLMLALVLPFAEEGKKEETETKKNDRGTKDNELALLDSPVYSPEVATKSAWEAMNDNHKVDAIYVWGEDSKTEIVCKNELTHIAAAFNKDNNKIYLLYKEKFQPNLFFRSYLLESTKLMPPKQFITFKEKVQDRNGIYSIFGQTENDRFKCYVTHLKGVFCVTAGFTKDIIPSYKHQYHPANVEADTTLFKLGNNAGLAGGSMAGWKSGKAFAANGQAVEGNSCLGPIDITEEEHTNPIVDYDEEEKIIIIGNDEKEVTETIVIETITVDGDIVEGKRFAYFAHINPKKKVSAKITYSGTDYKEFARVNAVTHISGRLGRKLFIFPRDMFRDGDLARYFVYDSRKKTVNAYELPEAMLKAVSDAKMQIYDSIQVAPVGESLIYVFLNKVSKKDETLTTQVLYLNIDPPIVCACPESDR